MRPLRLIERGAAIVVAAMLALPAFAASFTFHQSGFEDGATLSGSFEGTAGDDGLIELSELGGFTASFSGNTLVAPFQLGKQDLDQFRYVVNTGSLGDDSSEGMSTMRVLAGPSVTGSLAVWTYVLSEDLGSFSLSGSPIGVTAVPEPSAAVFLLAGLAMLVTVRRWRA